MVTLVGSRLTVRQDAPCLTPRPGDVFEIGLVSSEDPGVVQPFLAAVEDVVSREDGSVEWSAVVVSEWSVR